MENIRKKNSIELSNFLHNVLYMRKLVHERNLTELKIFCAFFHNSKALLSQMINYIGPQTNESTILYEAVRHHHLKGCGCGWQEKSGMIIPKKCDMKFKNPNVKEILELLLKFGGNINIFSPYYQK